MTFYQELQLNQAGSKELLRKSETAQERRYHALVYLAKVAITMLFCFAFVSVFSILFGNENSVVGCFIVLNGIPQCGFWAAYRAIYSAAGVIFCGYGGFSAFGTAGSTTAGVAFECSGTCVSCHFRVS